MRNLTGVKVLLYTEKTNTQKVLFGNCISIVFFLNNYIQLDILKKEKPSSNFPRASARCEVNFTGIATNKIQINHCTLSITFLECLTPQKHHRTAFQGTVHFKRLLPGTEYLDAVIL